MSLEKAKELLSQLEPQAGLPEELHGWRFDEPLDYRGPSSSSTVEEYVEYLLERCKRAEDRLKPVTESELRAAFENQPLDNLFPLAKEPQIMGAAALKSWLACARYLGKLKP